MSNFLGGLSLGLGVPIGIAGGLGLGPPGWIALVTGLSFGFGALSLYLNTVPPTELYHCEQEVWREPMLLGCTQ